VGSGSAAKRGDEVSVYFAGALYETGDVQFYGWPPSGPSVFELGSGLYGKEWEKSIEGMKVGGIRQVILPSSEFAEGKPVDYVIALTNLQPKSK
jgi:FKBP-type peptidyl-prolyl cis-trans isomerase